MLHKKPPKNFNKKKPRFLGGAFNHLFIFFYGRGQSSRLSGMKK